MGSDTATWWAAASAITSAFVALVSAIVGPTVAYRIAKRQIQATVVSSNRQQWINALRDDMCELLVHLKMTTALRDPRFPSDLKIDVTQFMENSVRLRNRVALRLNPSEPSHKKLLQVIDAYSFESAAPTEPLTLKDSATASATLLNAAQDVLKSEWERVKTGN